MLLKWTGRKFKCKSGKNSGRERKIIHSDLPG